MARNVSARYKTEVSEFALTSSAVAGGQSIPRRYTCEGDDLSPELSWTEPPEGTRLLALEGHVLAVAELVGVYERS